MNTNLIASLAVSFTLLTASAGAVTLLPNAMTNSVQPAVLTLNIR
jgi:hypothetical protein